MEKLAIFGGEPVRTGPVAPWPQFDQREVDNLMDALKAGGWGGYPEPMPMAAAFADRFARFQDALYGVMCSNGSVSLELALIAAGVGWADEVIVPAYTWIATAAAPVHVNAVPVFVDSDPVNYCIDPAGIEAAITSRTRAIIPVHLGASVADMDRIMEIARRHDLVVIEDCAHAHGAKWKGRGVGSIGDFGSFSFQTSKPMTCGEGGIVITNNREYAKRVHSLVNCGRKEGAYAKFEGDVFGYNYRITEFQAAVLLAQMEKFGAWLEKRQANLERLTSMLDEADVGVHVITRDSRVTSRGVYEAVLKYDAGAFNGLDREVFLKALVAEGVEMEGDFYVPVYQSEIFRASAAQWPALRERYGDGIGPDAARCPVAEHAAYKESLWLHHSYLMGDEADVDDIVRAVVKVHGHSKELLGVRI